MPPQPPLPTSPPPALHRRLDAPVVGLARLVVALFFRHLEVIGGARLPRSGPLVVVANHQNGMIDPLLIVAALAGGAGGASGIGGAGEAGRGAGSAPLRMPRFLATHMLWRNPVLRPWLELGGVIPIYRPKDVGAGGDPAQNAAAFARCHEQLAAGGVVSLFPEGTSHSEPGLAPLKTGAARIVLEAARRFPALRPLVVPIGLTFEAKGTFRSRALVEVGEPIDAAPYIAADREEGGDFASPAAVRLLTARIETGLEAVTLTDPGWYAAGRPARPAELFAGGGGLPGELHLAERFEAHRALVEGYAELSRRHPAPTAAAAEAVDRYDRMLSAFGLRDDQVAATYPAAAAARWLALTVLRLALLLPLALVGMALNWLPYRLVGEIAARATREADMPASFKVFGGMVLFPLAWLLEAAAAGWWGRPALVLPMLIVAPLTGYVALRFDDRRGRLWREARAYVLLRSRRAVGDELRRRRAAAAEAVAGLVELYRQGARDGQQGSAAGFSERQEVSLGL